MSDLLRALKEDAQRMEDISIEAGEVYEVNDDWHRVAGGYDSIRLENNENGNWLELQQETIDQYFELAEEGET